MPKEGKKNVLVICPGFSSDCVETLEEISIQGKESFLKMEEKKNFDVVPCLNDNDDHINLLEHLAKNFCPDERILNIQITTLNSSNFLDGGITLFTKNICLPFGNKK